MKVPEPRKLPSGTWFIQMRLNGVSVPVSASTKKECIRQAQLIKAEHRAETRVIAPKSKNTIKQIMKDYVDSLPGDTSPSTIRGYDIIQRNRFNDILEKKPSDVNWQSVVDATYQKYSYKTAKNSWSFLCSCLRAAGAAEPDVTLPKQKKKSKERPFLQPEEILKVIPLLEGRKYEIPALLALHSLRRSEIMGLDYSDIDLKNKTITVHGAAVQDKDNKIVSRDVNKTVESERVIPIMIPQLEAAIKKSGKKSGPVWEGSPCGLYRTMEDVCNILGIPNVGAHGLRHSFASLAYHLGFSDLQTMEFGGWSDIQTVRGIYTHIAKIDRVKATNAMTNFYKNANENANEEKTD